MEFPFTNLTFLSPFNQQKPQGNNDRVPARVMAAMQFLSQMSEKTNSRIAVGQIGEPQEFKGQSLSVYELNAVNEACHLIERYFSGKMRLSKFEKDLQPEKSRGKGSMLNCIACAGNGTSRDGMKACKVCEGSGTILVYPCVEKQ